MASTGNRKIPLEGRSHGVIGAELLEAAQRDGQNGQNGQNGQRQGGLDLFFLNVNRVDSWIRVSRTKETKLPSLRIDEVFRGTLMFELLGSVLYIRADI